MNGDGKLYVREVQNPSTEKRPEWVVIDTFDEIIGTRSYEMGTRVYYDDRIVSERVKPEHYNLIGNYLGTMSGVIPMQDIDMVIPPDIRMYITLGRKLKHKGFLFNKKKHEIIKKGGV